MRRTMTRLGRTIASPDFCVPLAMAASFGATVFMLAGGSDPWSSTGMPALWGTAAGLFGMLVGIDLCDRAGADTPARAEG